MNSCPLVPSFLWGVTLNKAIINTNTRTVDKQRHQPIPFGTMLFKKGAA